MLRGADWFRGEIARMRDELRLPGRALSAGVIVPLPLAARIVAVVEAAERLEYAIGQDDSEAARDAAESYRAATRGKPCG